MKFWIPHVDTTCALRFELFHKLAVFAQKLQHAAREDIRCNPG
jgi:hypothetical protein